MGHAVWGWRLTVAAALGTPGVVSRTHGKEA
jgi:hypothetical protein